MAFEVFFVDGHHHVNHFARRDFRLLVVFVHLARHVAVFTLDTQGSGDELHRRDNLLSGNALERLYVLVFLFRQFWRNSDA